MSIVQLELYNLRKNENDMTQQDVANYLGITVQTYRLKEKGRNEFTQDEMFLLSELFDKDISEIFLPRKHRNGDKDKQQA